jgi:multiple sugar transport system substrate-binding protein
VNQISRRSFLRVTSVSIVAAAVAACGATPTATPLPKPTAVPVPPSPTPAPAKPVTVEFWSNTSEEWPAEAAAEALKVFSAKYPNIKINISDMASSVLDPKLQTALGAGVGGPDVSFYNLTDFLPGALDLRPFITADKFDSSIYYPNAWNLRAKWGDVVVGLPLGIGGNFVMYNTTHFDEKKIAYPKEGWTTEDFLSLSKQLADPTKKRWGGDRPGGPFRAIWFSYGTKARLYSDDSKTVEGYLNSAESLAAYTWLWDLVQSNATPTPADLAVLAKENTGPVDLFLAGRLSMATLNQAHLINAIKAGAKFGVVPEPRAPNGVHMTNMWSQTLSIWNKSKVPQEAWTFLKWWAGPEGQKILMDKGTLFPSIPSIGKDNQYAKLEQVQAFFRVLELPTVAIWRRSHYCEGTITRAVKDLWDLVNLGTIKREEIKAKLDALVPTAQTELNTCVARLGS